MQVGSGNRWSVGEVILDLYEVAGLLGEGGFGTVYRARHLGWQFELAIKVPKPEAIASAANRDRCEREAETWVNLGLHPHTTSCYYVRRWQGVPLIFAEYVAGGSLKDWLQDGRLYQGGTAAALKRLLDISIQFAWGLDYAHEQGLIHQDVKPANVLLTPQGVVKVTDFGLASAKFRLAAARAASSPPPEGQRQPASAVDWAEMGDLTLQAQGDGALTPAYCAPEQLQRGTLTRRSDLWSWALSVLELFQGERTWSVGSSGAEALEQYLQAPAASARPAMPAAVAQLLRACFQPDPDRRPYSLREVAAQLGQIYGEVAGERYPRRLPQASPEPAAALNNRALSLLDLGKPAEAVQLWQQAHQTQPHHPASTYNCGLWLWRSAQIGDLTLVRELEKSRAVSETWQHAYLLGLVHLERDDCEAAIAQFETIATPSRAVAAALSQARQRQPAAQQLLSRFQDDERQVNAVCFSADGGYALAGRHDGLLTVWDLRTNQYHAFGGRAKEGIRHVAIVADNRYAIATSDRSLKLWSLRTGQCLADFDLQLPWELPPPDPEPEADDQLDGLDLGDFFVVSQSSTGRARTSIRVPSPARSLPSSRPVPPATPGGPERYSADGRFCLVKTIVTLELRELATGEVLHRCRPSGAPLHVTPDGRYGLSLDEQPQLWDLATGECRQRFNGHSREVTAIALLPDGRRCLTCSADRTLKLWSLASGRCQATLNANLSQLRALAVSPDGRYALVGGRGWQLWALETQRCLRTFAETTAVRALAYSPGGDRLLLGGAGWELWSVALAQPPYIAPLCLNRVQASETLLSERDRYEQALERAQTALTAARATEAVQALRVARALPDFSREPRALDLWLQLYRYLPREGLRAAWDVATLTGHNGYINAVAIAADSQTLLSGGSDNTLRLWSLPLGPEIRTLSGYFRGTLNAVQFSPDDRQALSGSSRGSLKLWDLSSGNCLHTFESKGGAATACFSPDGHYALAGGDNGDVKLWEVATGRCLRILSGHAAPVRAVAFSPDGRLALSGDAGAGDRRPVLNLWEVASGRQLQSTAAHARSIATVAFSPDGRYALSGSEDGTLNLWATNVGRALRVLRGHRGAIASACFTPDGRYALSGSEDNTLRLWDVSSGQCLHCFEGHVTAVNAIAISPDSRYVVSGSNDGSCKVWLLDWELSDQPPADWDEGARAYLENFLALHVPYTTPLLGAAAAPAPTAAARRSAPPARPYQFFALLFALAWAGTAAAVEIFAPGSLDSVPLAIGMAIFVSGFFFGRQAGNPTVQLGSLFGVLILAIIALGAALGNFALAGSALFGAVAALVGTGTVLGLAASNPVSDLPGIRACRWLKAKIGAPLTAVALLVTLLAGIAVELALNRGYIHPLVVCILLAIALPGVALLGWQRRSGRRSPWLQTLAILVLMAIATFKWAIPSSLGLATPAVCHSAAVAQVYLARGGRANAWVRPETHAIPILNCSLRAGHADIARRLLARGARADAVGYGGTTPLHLAAEQDDAEIVTQLLARGADPQAEAQDKITPLHLAQSIEVAEALLAAGASVDAITAYSGTPLHAAVKVGRLPVAQHLMDAGADVNARCRNCEATTPLHAAVQYDRPALVERLLAAGSEVNARDRYSRTPLYRAREAENAAMIQLLSRYGGQE